MSLKPFRCNHVISKSILGNLTTSATAGAIIVLQSIKITVSMSKRYTISSQKEKKKKAFASRNSRKVINFSIMVSGNLVGLLVVNI